MHAKVNRSRVKRPARRAQAIVALLVGLTLLLGLGAMVWDIAMISAYQRQLDVGLEAASLAGVSQLMDRSLLDANLERLELADAGLPSAATTIERQATLARKTAARFAAENRMAGEPILLTDNPNNVADGDLVIANLADPRDLLSSPDVWSKTGPANTLIARSDHSESMGNSIAMRFGRFLGLMHVDLTVQVQASLDQRVYGFQPVDHANAPLFPLVVAPAGSPESWREQACAETLAGANDQYSVDWGSDSVTPESREILGGAFKAEPDGVPEIVLRISPGRVATGPHLISFDAAPLDEATLESQIVLGLSAADLLPLGGKFALSRDGTLDLPQPTAP
ncbi:MAG: hypothetical protein KDA42_05640, partial [Planctomycetales bacterium]|nr:hypothetical protein [Planctomycetales bacterium]